MQSYTYSIIWYVSDWLLYRQIAISRGGEVDGSVGEFPHR